MNTNGQLGSENERPEDSALPQSPTQAKERLEWATPLRDRMFFAAKTPEDVSSPLRAFSAPSPWNRWDVKVETVAEPSEKESKEHSPKGQESSRLI